jgi:hypothetical protein
LIDIGTSFAPTGQVVDTARQGTSSGITSHTTEQLVDDGVGSFSVDMVDDHGSAAASATVHTNSFDTLTPFPTVDALNVSAQANAISSLPYQRTIE